MNRKIITIYLALFLLGGLASHTNAAIMPSLILSYPPNSNSTQINVTGDANASVQLYYLTDYDYQTNYQYNNNSYFVGTIGETNYDGYLDTTVNYGQYNIPTGDYVYVIVDGASSAPVLWSGSNNNNYNYNNYDSSSISFSQNNISLNLGQSANVTIYDGIYSNGYYLQSNSSLVETSISGNALSIYAAAAGSTTLEICSDNNYSCGSLNITIYGNTTYSQYEYYPTQYYSNQYSYQYPISLSQSSVSMNTGQSSSVNIYGSGSYYLNNISTPNVISASLSGSVLYIYAYNPGSTNITVCQYAGSCATVYVSVANTYSVSHYLSPKKIYYKKHRYF